MSFLVLLLLLPLALSGPIPGSQDAADINAENVMQMREVMEKLIKLARERNITLDHYKSIKSLEKRQILIDPEIAKEMEMTVPQLIRHRGYPAEEHRVTTEDKYINTLHRIPCGRQGPSHNPLGSPRPVAFLQHGLLDSSYTYINNLEHQSLGFILADAGYDVWLGNMRGNRHSRKHVELDPDEDDKYWKFSFDHVAKYDLSAAFKFITSKTGKEQLFYVGHSLGTTVAFGGFSMYPELAAKVKVFVGLAPVAKVEHIKGIFAWMAPISDLVAELYSWIGGHEFIPNHWIFKILAEFFCNEAMAGIGCENVLYLIFGYNDLHINRTRLPIYTTNTPAGTSIQNIMHLGQNVNSGLFKYYDYGSANKNKKVYGTSEPPDYDLANYKTKTALYWSKIDWMTQQPDVEWLLQQLKVNGHNSLLYATHVDTYTHVDFVWAKNANEKIYHNIVKLFNENQ